MGNFRLTTVAVGVALDLGFASAAIADEMTGSVKAVSNPARIIAVEVANKGVVVFKFDAATQYKNTASAKDIIRDEVVTVDFSQAEPENRAKTRKSVV